MLRLSLVFALLVPGAAPVLQAQEAGKDDEMLFVQRLRERGHGYSQLALDYLEKRLKTNPKYAADAPLEIALTRAAVARSEPDSAKRVTLFGQCAADLGDFVTKNPAHHRVGSARLEMARIASDQGRTQLTRAMALPEGDENRGAELNRAIQLLENAAKIIGDVAGELKNDKEKSENEYERGVLLVSQGRAYLALSKVDTKQQSKLEKASSDALKAAITVLDGLGDKLEANDPIKARSLSWCARALSLNAEQVGKVARKCNEAKQAAQTARDAAAMRQITYFEMLQLFENEQGIKPAEAVSLRSTGVSWLNTYPGYRNTPEGYGVQFILAKLYFEAGKTATRDINWTAARNYIRSIEATDNEFTAQAQELKIRILVEQKAFERPIQSLTSFEDLYMRALYEHQQLGKESKKFEKPEDKKKQQDLIIATLKRAMEANLAAEKRGIKAPGVDLANAYYLQTGYYLTVENFAEAARVGQEFIAKHPRERHANTIAMFTARSLSDVIKKGAGEDFDQMADEREKLYKLGQFMSERWPGDKAGDFGKFLVALHLIKKPLTAATEEGQKAERKKREEDALKIAGDVARFHLGVERAKQKKFFETVVLLYDIKPGFSNYTLASYQLALAAQQLEKDDAQRTKDKKPSVLEEENAERAKRGEKPLVLGSSKTPFKEIALMALERIPDTVDLSEGETALFFFRAKTELGFLLYSVQQFDKMEQLSTRLLPVLEGVKSVPEMEKGIFHLRLNSIRFYALYGKADVGYRAGKFDEVARTLDPFINELKADKYPELKEDTRLLNAMLGLSLRSNLQAEKGTRAKEVFDVWKKFQKEGEDVVSGVLTQTVVVMKKQIDELRKKGDKAKLDSVVNNLSGFLAQFKGDEKSLTPDLRLLLSQCYVPIGRYAQAVELLKAYPAPAPDEADAKVTARYKVVQVLLMRAYRMQGKDNKDTKSFEEAKKLLDKIMAPTPEDMAKKQPGWGKRDINALKEEAYLYVDMDAYGAAVNRANTLLGILGKQLGGGGAARDHYFEVAYLYVLSFTKSALALKTDSPADMAKRENYLTRTAKFYNTLATNHPTLGGEEHKDRFDSFFKTPEGQELQKYIDKLK